MRRENIVKYEGRKRGRKRSVERREINKRGSKNGGGRGWVDGDGCSTATLFIQVKCRGSC